jgi:hypothetical protein
MIRFTIALRLVLRRSARHRRKHQWRNEGLCRLLPVLMPLGGRKLSRHFKRAED